jgi:hypothetical protein
VLRRITVPRRPRCIYRGVRMRMREVDGNRLCLCVCVCVCVCVLATRRTTRNQRSTVSSSGGRSCYDGDKKQKCINVKNTQRVKGKAVFKSVFRRGGRAEGDEEVRHKETNEETAKQKAERKPTSFTDAMFFLLFLPPFGTSPDALYRGGGREALLASSFAPASICDIR